MAVSSHTFPAQELRFLPYKPPPEPKVTYLGSPSLSRNKMPSNKVVRSGLGKILGTKPESNTGEEGRAIPAPIPPDVEVIDLTCLASEGNHGISDDGGACGNIGSNVDFTPPNELRTAGSERNVLQRTSRQDTCDEISSQPTPSEGSCQENAVVIEDSQPESEPESDTNTDNKDCPLENDISTQTHDPLEVPGTSTSDRRGGECSTGMEDAINSELVEEHEPRASGLLRPRRGSMPMRPTVDVSLPLLIYGSEGNKVVRSASLSLTANFEPATQEDGGDGLPKAAIHQLQLPIYQKAKGQAKDSRITNSSSGSSNAGSDDDTNDNNNGTHTPGVTRKRKRTDDGSNRGGRVPSNKRRKSGSRFRADKHVEYEVKQIVDVRMDNETDLLQYRVLWVGYKHDPTWYDASNFKNSPHKLNDFHKANPTRPGPPKRLGVWLKCWEDTADHPDDNMPQ